VLVETATEADAQLALARARELAPDRAAPR
jgi:hypothetical protein